MWTWKLTMPGCDSGSYFTYFCVSADKTVVILSIEQFLNSLTSTYYFSLYFFVRSIMRMLRNLKKIRPNREVSIIHLIIWAIFVCLIIRIWKELGCFGIPQCYLCRTFTPDIIINHAAAGSSADDFTRLMNLDNFTFLINNLACNNTDLLLLVLVHSDPYNFENRLTIRSTWGNIIDDKFKLLFLLGIPNSTVVQKRIQEENNANGDLVQGNFADSYRNLTYKHVMALKWTKYFCPNARFLLKTDDDVFVNMHGFLRYLTHGLPQKGLLRCLPVYEARAKRTTRSKWRVTWTEYQFRFYPPYCQGFAILYSPDVVSALYAKAQIANYFWIDDVFVTGFLAMFSNFTHSTFGKHMLEPKEFDKLMRRNQNFEDFSYLLGPWNLNASDIKKLWERTFKWGYSPNRGEVES